MIFLYDLIWFTYITWYVDWRFEDSQLIYMWVFLGKNREGESMKKPARDWLTLRGWCSWKSRRQPQKRQRAIIDKFWHNKWLQQEGICNSLDERSICRITNIHIINREMNLNDTMTWWILFGSIRNFQFEWTALAVVFSTSFFWSGFQPEFWLPGTNCGWNHVDSLAPTTQSHQGPNWTTGHWRSGWGSLIFRDAMPGAYSAIGKCWKKCPKKCS